MAKVIRTVFENETLSLHEATDGYWLYDTIVGMNISMRAKTEQDAFIESLMYYQRTLKETRKKLHDIDDKVKNFLSKFDEEED